MLATSITKLIAIDAINLGIQHVQEALERAMSSYLRMPQYSSRHWVVALRNALGQLYVGKIALHDGALPPFRKNAGWITTTEIVLRASLMTLEHKLGKRAAQDDMRNRLRAAVAIFHAPKRTRNPADNRFGHSITRRPQPARRLKPQA